MSLAKIQETAYVWNLLIQGQCVSRLYLGDYEDSFNLAIWIEVDYQASKSSSVGLRHHWNAPDVKAPPKEGHSIVGIYQLYRSGCGWTILSVHQSSIALTDDFVSENQNSREFLTYRDILTNGS